MTADSPEQERAGERRVAIVVHCQVCNYFAKTSVQPGTIGTHGCAQCDGQMDVYVEHHERAPWSTDDLSWVNRVMTRNAVNRSRATPEATP